jgi:hypothetical protein
MGKMNTSCDNYHDTGGGASKKNVPSGRYTKEFQKEAVNSGNQREVSCHIKGRSI